MPPADVSDVITGSPGAINFVMPTLPAAVDNDPYGNNSPVGAAQRLFQQQGAEARTAVGGMVGGGLGTAKAGAIAVQAGTEQINTAQAAAEAQLRRDNLSAIAALGGNPADAASLIGKLSADTAKKLDIANAQGAHISQQMQVSFLDDPITWLYNQIALPFNIEARNETVSEIQQNFAVLRGYEEVTQEEFQKNKNIDVIDANQKMLGLNKIAAGEAQLKISDAEFKAANLGIQAASVRNAMDANQFHAAIAVNDQKIKNDEYNLHLTGMAINIANVNLEVNKQQQDALRTMMNAPTGSPEWYVGNIGYNNYEIDKLPPGQEREDAIIKNLSLIEKFRTEEIQARTIDLERNRLNMTNTNLDIQQKAIAEMQGQLDNVLKIHGMAPMSIYALERLSTPLRTQLETEMTDPDIQKGRLGFDVVKALEAGKLGKQPPMALSVLDSLNKTANAEIMKQPMFWKNLAPEVQHAMLLAALTADVNKQANNIPDTGSIYSPPPLSSVLKIPAIAALPVTKDLEAAALANPGYATKAQDIFEAIIAGIDAGKWSPDQGAQQIATIFKAINTDNAQNMLYARFNLPALGSSAGYKTTLQIGGTVAGTGISDYRIDLTNIAQVNNAIIRGIIQKNMMKSINLGIPPQGLPGTGP